MAVHSVDGAGVVGSVGQRIVWLVALTLSVAVVSTFVYRSSYAAFSDTTENPANAWDVGTLTLTDDDGGVAMFDVDDIFPGDTGTKCITVTNAGSPPDAVRLYATTAGALAPQLDLTIEWDADAGSFSDCSGFTSDGTLYAGKLGSLPTGWATGLALGGSTSTSLAPWTPATNGVRTFRFTWTLPSATDQGTYEGTGATATFTWEAQA